MLRGAPGIHIAEAKDMLLNTHKIAPPAKNDPVQNTSVIPRLKRPWGFPAGSESREFACNVEDQGAIPVLERFPGEGNGYPLHSCLENSKKRGGWWATVHGVAKSQI